MRLGLGVATEHYGEYFRPELALRGRELDAVAAANRFLTLRTAFVGQGGFLPPLNSIKDALALRKDPHLRAVREQLALLHGGLVAVTERLFLRLGERFRGRVRSSSVEQVGTKSSDGLRTCPFR